jgi:hypothetical protein
MNTKDLSYVHQKWWTFYEINLFPFWYTLLRSDTRYVRGNVRCLKIQSVYKLRVVKMNRATGKIEGTKVLYLVLALQTRRLLLKE